MLRTKDGKLMDVQQLTREELVSQIALIDSQLAEIIENLADTSFDGTFYKANYPFGSGIISDGKCYLPLRGGDSIAFDDVKLPDKVRADLAYNPITEDPLGLIMNKTSEFYFPLRGRILPHNIITSGQMFGIPRATDSNAAAAVSALSRSLNAGARSLFMLPKIGAQHQHKRLQHKYGIQSPTPRSVDDHWQIFEDIAKQANCSWRFQVIYFSRQWINKLKTKEWSQLTTYLMQLNRGSYNILHSKAQIWNATFSEIEQEKRLAANYPMYSLGTAKHIFLIAANSALGFRPAVNNEMAPINVLQEAYINGYGLKQQKYGAIIMEPTTFNLKHSHPVYYSLSQPTFEQYNSEISKNKSQIILLDEIMRIIDIYRKAILSSRNLDKSLYDAIDNTTFSYYHSTPQDYKNILDATNIETNDTRFSFDQDSYFPAHSPFFKGCIKIARKS